MATTKEVLSMALLVSTLLLATAEGRFLQGSSPASLGKSDDSEKWEEVTRQFFAKAEVQELLKKYKLEASILSEVPETGNGLRKKREADEDPEETRKVLKNRWEEDKAAMLASYLEEVVMQGTNVTVVGWQQVYDDQGKVVAVNTVEFLIPPKTEGGENSSKSEDDDDDDDDDIADLGDRHVPHKLIRQLRESFVPLEEAGFSAAGAFESWTKDGEDDMMLYVGKDMLFQIYKGFSIINKTYTVADQAIVDAFVKNVGTEEDEVAVLKLDHNLNLKPESRLEPHLIGGVISSEGATGEMLMLAPIIMAQVVTENIGDLSAIPKKLAERFNKAQAFKDYKWRVLVDSEDSYVTKDVEFQLTYDNLDFYESSDTSYMVYGVKREK